MVHHEPQAEDSKRQAQRRNPRKSSAEKRARQLVLMKQVQHQKLPATRRSRKRRALHALDSASRGGSSAASRVTTRRAISVCSPATPHCPHRRPPAKRRVCLSQPLPGGLGLGPWHRGTHPTHLPAFRSACHWRKVQK